MRTTSSSKAIVQYLRYPLAALPGRQIPCMMYYYASIYRRDTCIHTSRFDVLCSDGVYSVCSNSCIRVVRVHYDQRQLLLVLE